MKQMWVLNVISRYFCHTFEVMYAFIIIFLRFIREHKYLSTFQFAEITSEAFLASVSMATVTWNHNIFLMSIIHYSTLQINKVENEE